MSGYGRISYTALTVLMFIPVFFLLKCKQEEPKPTTLAIVSTGEITEITSVSAKVSAQVTSDGNLGVIDRGIAISTKADPTISDYRVSAGFGEGMFSAFFTGLTAATIYHVRAYATNSKGTTYGLDKTFLTEPGLPILSTNSATSITATGSVTGGNITSDGGAPITARGVVYGISPNPDLTSSKTTDDSGTGTFASILSGLAYATKYYVRAYATNSVGTAYGNSVEFITLANPNLNSNLTYGSVSDIDGNKYATIAIGAQTWMAENLKVSRYKNGEAISNVTDASSWAALTTGAFVYFNNEMIYNAVCGKLYNWYAVIDARGLCPAGWHVPSDEDWTTLTNYLGGESVAGGKMKSTGISLWRAPNIEATNESGFSGLPGDIRYGGGAFGVIGQGAVWWSSTEGSSIFSWDRRLAYSNGAVFRGDGAKRDGFSVRCLKD